MCGPIYRVMMLWSTLNNAKTNYLLLFILYRVLTLEHWVITSDSWDVRTSWHHYSSKHVHQLEVSVTVRSAMVSYLGLTYWCHVWVQELISLLGAKTMHTSFRRSMCICTHCICPLCVYTRQWNGCWYKLQGVWSASLCIAFMFNIKALRWVMMQGGMCTQLFWGTVGPTRK